MIKYAQHFDNLDTKRHLVRMLTPEAIGIELRVKVLSEMLTVSTTTPEGVCVSWTELLVGDESGCISLQGRTEGLKGLEPGSIAELSGLITVVDDCGHMRLRMGKWSQVNIIPHQDDDIVDFTVNLEKNMTEQLFVRTHE